MVTTDDGCHLLLKIMIVYNYADVLVEGAFRTTECRLAQMNVFSHLFTVRLLGEMIAYFL